MLFLELTLKQPIRSLMIKALFLIFLISSTSVMAIELRDAIVHVEIHERLGRVKQGRGFFYSGFGEFAVLRSIVEPAQKDPYSNLLAFKTNDGRTLNDIKFSHCDKDVEKGFCFYKANYVPYRKIDTKENLPPLKEGEMMYAEGKKGYSKAKIEAHPNKKQAWSTAKSAEGKIPGTLLFDEQGQARAVVTSQTLRDSNLIVRIDGVKEGSLTYHPIEQQNNQSLPQSLQETGKNMARMVADVSRMSEDQIKKALDALFVPSTQSMRAGVGARQINNHLQGNRKEEVVVQEAMRGDQDRKEFFKLEQKAIEAQSSLKDGETEMGKLEKKLAMKEKLHGVLEIQNESLTQNIAADSVKLELEAGKMGTGEKEELQKKLAGQTEKLNKTKEKSKAIGQEIAKLKEQLAGLKGQLEVQQAKAKELADKAREEAKKNAGALQGNMTYHGDLL